MDPISNNQMNSVYQAPVGKQPAHRTSIVSIVILLIIAIIVAVLGFGRINNIKEEDARAKAELDTQQQSAQAQVKAEQARRAQDANMVNDLNSISSTSTTVQEKSQIDSSF
jgi:predicted Holliday junction resolvase-like endonuclease